MGGEVGAQAETDAGGRRISPGGTDGVVLVVVVVVVVVEAVVGRAGEGVETEGGLLWAAATSGLRERRRAAAGSMSPFWVGRFEEEEEEGVVGRLAIARDPDATWSSEGSESATTLNDPTFLFATAETRGLAGSFLALVATGLMVDDGPATAAPAADNAANEDPASGTPDLCRFLEDAREVGAEGDGGPAEMEREEGRDARGRDGPASGTRGKPFAVEVEDDEPGDDALEWSNPLIGGGATKDELFPGPTSEESDMGELVPSLVVPFESIAAGARGWKQDEEEGER